MSFSLYNSILCRLCAEPTPNGISLNTKDDEGRTNYTLINKYLPLKVDDDGQLPQTLCPGCHLQIQNVACFLGLIIKGQSLLQKVYKHVVLKEEVGELPEEFAKDLFGSDVCNKNELYTTDHHIRTEIVDIIPNKTPKRKRGRPRKDEARPPPAVDTNELRLEESLPPPSEVNEVPDSLPDGKRRRKKPAWYLEAIQGHELDKVFKEHGVYEDNFESNCFENDVKSVQEVIGQMQDGNGETLGMVVVCSQLIDNRKKLQFHCETCQAVFLQENKFLEHVASHKADQNNFCLLCQIGFLSADDFQKHLQENGHNNEGAELSACDVPNHLADASIDQQLTNEQGGSAVESPPKSQCPVCDATFRFASNLKSHMRSAHDNVVGGFPCDICGKKLKHPSSVVYHKETEHNIDRKFVCSKCNMAFKHRRLLQKHQRVHSIVKGLACSICGKTFKSKDYLKIHLQIHGSGKKFVCEICNQIVTHRTALIVHMRMHTGEKPFECNFCNKTFSQKGNLQEHMRIHTGEKPFKCKICTKCFTTSSQLKLHLKRHIGVKPYECDICLKSFLHKDTLATHMRRHTGEKPYECEYCKKTFTELGAVKKHVRIHTGERPYMCTICGKTFSDNSNLGKHKKSHKTETDGSILVTDILPEGLSVSDLTLVDSSDDQQFWAVIKQAADAQNDKESDTQQVIYITYNDPDDPNSKVSETLLVNKDNGEDEEPISRMSTSNSPPQTCSNLLPSESVHVAPPEGQVVMDEHGNPLRFTTADGGIFQVTTIDGESLQLTGSDGSSMPVRITTADGETLTPSGLEMASLVSDVTEDTLVSTAVDSLDLVGAADVRLLSEAALDFLPLP